MDSRAFYALLGEISERAEKMGLLVFDRLSLEMDIECAHKKFNLRLEELLHADDFNFAHDIVGIQHHIDRRNGKMADVFVPRFSGVKRG